MNKRVSIKNLVIGVLASIAILPMTVSCSDDDKLVITDVTFTAEVTTELPSFTLASGNFTVRNVNSGAEVTVANGETASVTEGLYNITFAGEGTYDAGEGTAEVNVQGVLQNVSITATTGTVTVPAFVQSASSSFVIAEVFGVGTYTPENKQYNGDQYVRIVNNSDETQYADGLIFMESKFTTTSRYDYTPDIMSEALAVQAVAVIPGSGTDVPVLPGESIIICDNAINHTEANVNSFDLSGANFEWYVESTSASNPDVDNPAVPNLDMWYCYTSSIWILNKQGNRVYAIGKLPDGVSKETYLSDYTYEYTYVLANGNTSKTQNAYRFPNEWIIDAVTLSPSNSYEWNITAPSVDMGHTYYGENSTIAENIGKAVVRKVAYTVDGREVLQDTNNSSVDFTPSAQGSLTQIAN